MVLISEESAARGESLQDIVVKIADLVEERQDLGSNFGTVLIPEGLLSHVASFQPLLEELNSFMQTTKTEEQLTKLQKQLISDQEYLQSHLSPWNYSLWTALPEFMRVSMINGYTSSTNLCFSHIETEKLLGYLVEAELKKRKKDKNFAYLTHFFGYQGRAA